MKSVTVLSQDSLSTMEIVDLLKLAEEQSVSVPRKHRKNKDEIVQLIVARLTEVAATPEPVSEEAAPTEAELKKAEQIANFELVMEEVNKLENDSATDEMLKPIKSLIEGKTLNREQRKLIKETVELKRRKLAEKFEGLQVQHYEKATIEFAEDNETPVAVHATAVIVATDIYDTNNEYEKTTFNRIEGPKIIEFHQFVYETVLRFIPETAIALAKAAKADFTAEELTTMKDARYVIKDRYTKVLDFEAIPVERVPYVSALALKICKTWGWPLDTELTWGTEFEIGAEIKLSDTTNEDAPSFKAIVQANNPLAYVLPSDAVKGDLSSSSFLVTNIFKVELSRSSEDVKAEIDAIQTKKAARKLASIANEEKNEAANA